MATSKKKPAPAAKKPSPAAKKPSPAPKKPATKPDSAFVAGSDPLAVAPAPLTSLPAPLAGVTPTPALYDPKAADNLVADYRPRLLAIAPDRLDTPRVDVDAVGMALLNVYALIEAPALRALYDAAADRGE